MFYNVFFYGQDKLLTTTWLEQFEPQATHETIKTLNHQVNTLNPE